MKFPPLASIASAWLLVLGLVATLGAQALRAQALGAGIDRTPPGVDSATVASEGEAHTEEHGGYRFEITDLPRTESYAGMAQGEIARLEIFQDDSLVQVLRDVGAYTNEDEQIDLVDANFDGHLDLAIFAHDGGAGPNFTTNYYLYDPATHRFALHRGLSELCQPEIDPKAKAIHSASRGSAVQSETSLHKWIGGKLTKVQETETLLLDADNLVETTRTLKHGKWIVRVRRLRSD